MDKKNLLKLYRQVVRETGFKEDKTSEGWMPQLGPDDYRSVIREGRLNRERAVITVSPHEDLYEIADHLDTYRFQTHDMAEPIIRVPPIMQWRKLYNRDDTMKVSYMIQRALPNGDRILQNFPRQSSAEEKAEAAKLYWNTVKNFPKIDPDPSSYSATDYFLERADKFFASGRQWRTSIEKERLITEKEKNSALAVIFRHCMNMKMQPFFAHFGNADIVKTGDVRYYIWNSPIVFKPECAGIAYWIWSLVMNSYDLRPKRMLGELGQWLMAFDTYAPLKQQNDPKFGIRIWVNLVERMLGALLVDIPLSRSPLDVGLSRDRRKNIRDNCREILKLGIFTLADYGA